MKQYMYAIFDLDGTLLDTAEDLADSVNHALTLSNLNQRTLEEIKRFVGNGIANLISLSVGNDVSEDTYQKVLSDFKQHYASNIANKTKPFDGIIELLTALKEHSVSVAVSSNKYQAGVEELCELYFKDLYTAAFGERPNVPRKPDPSIVYTAIRQLGASSDLTLYIGDSEVDGQTAKNAGIDFVGVSWGLRPIELLIESGAMAIVDRPEHLLAFFEPSL
ncbi:MAG: HAD-IA family hydrolase [Oscillospiraceae bacterium]|nr:HAD-IA family hydrolase [Oscillospiraceae bacterium]